jgi:hypothetical protein
MTSEVDLEMPAKQCTNTFPPFNLASCINSIACGKNDFISCDALSLAVKHKYLIPLINY